jgi:hypothetical protein
MIVGAARWAERTTWYIQDNDILEELRRKLGDTHVRQSCGSDAACSCLEAAGWDLSGALATRTPAGYVAPPDDLITEYLNNPRNYDLLRRETGIDPTLQPNNRHAAMLVIAARELWGIQGSRAIDLSAARIADHLGRHCAVQACLTPPGHYIAVVAYDKATGEMIYNDSWHTRKPWWQGDGFNRRMTSEEEVSIVAEGIVWPPPV